jgi:hypothetical protein
MKIEFFEVEGRPVGRVSNRNRGTAWVWTHGDWHIAPGLIGKAYTDGYRMSRDAFSEEFPEADLDAFDGLAASVRDNSDSTKVKQVGHFRGDETMEIEYFEVEGRPVGRVSYRNRSAAWVWRDGRWGLAPGLISKASAHGYGMSREAFAAEFPEADLDAFAELAASFCASD